MDVPFVAIGGGIAIAACVIFVLHLRRGSGDASSIEKKLVKKKAAPKPEKKDTEPVERSCPSCDRTLRIPGDYSGTVRCPDCSEKFEVEAEPSVDLDEELDSIDDEVVEEKPVEKKIEIACPQCSSKLRVPSSYKFADPNLEALMPMQKQLLRAGPENTQRIQQQALALKKALLNP